MHVMYRTTRTAVRALRRNVLRSVLTCLGIIIGIAAVIALVEIGTGAGVAIQTAISRFGANIIMVFPGEASNNGVSFGTGTRVTLTPEDCQAIATECPAVRNAAPNVFARLQIVYENRNWQPNNLYGTTPAYLDVGNWEIAEGEAFTDHDVQSVRLVCLIGQTVAKQLFEDEDPIGKEIRVKNANLKVIGVLASKGANMMGWDQDDTLIAPWTTVRFRLSNEMLSNTNQSAALAANSNPFTAINSLNNWYPTAGVAAYPQPSAAQQADTPQPIRFHNIDQIIVSARSPFEIPAAVHQITALLRDRHHLQPGQPDDFQVLNISEFLKALTTATAMMTNLLLCVALISLLVGGVGIMNIMLVSVTERTREIGLRMAVGARGKDILRQFLVEAIVLCLLGGIIGILFGRGCSLLIEVLLHWPIATSVPAILGALFVSATVGIVFGYYPAWKASRLDPIDALRYE